MLVCKLGVEVISSTDRIAPEQLEADSATSLWVLLSQGSKPIKNGHKEVDLK